MGPFHVVVFIALRHDYSKKMAPHQSQSKLYDPALRPLGPLLIASTDPQGEWSRLDVGFYCILVSIDDRNKIPVKNKQFSYILS